MRSVSRRRSVAFVPSFSCGAERLESIRLLSGDIPALSVPDVSLDVEPENEPMVDYDTF